MPQADFVYQPANDAAGLPLAVSIFADRAHLREEIRDDVAAAGLAVRACGTLAALLESSSCSASQSSYSRMTAARSVSRCSGNGLPSGDGRPT